MLEFQMIIYWTDFFRRFFPVFLSLSQLLFLAGRHINDFVDLRCEGSVGDYGAVVQAPLAGRSGVVRDPVGVTDGGTLMRAKDPTEEGILKTEWENTVAG